MNKVIRYIPLLLFLFLFVFPSAQAAPIDLNDFFFFPGDPVIIALDGSSAEIGEDPAFSTILLSNDPVAGDPEVIFAADSGGTPQVLSFEFNFTEGPVPNDDEFGAFLFDSDLGPISGALGAPFEFFTNTSGSGSVSWDLSSLVGTTLGLQFELSALFADGAFDSTVVISNVDLSPVSAPVPEPGTLLLFSTGLAALFGAGRKRFRAFLS